MGEKRGLRFLRKMGQHMLRKSRWLFCLYVFLSTFVLVTLIRSFLRQEYFNMLVCLLTLSLFMIPAFLEKNFKMHLGSFFEGMVLLFIFSSEILGEINSYYQKIPHWDTVLHAVNGFMFAAFGFALLDMINQDDKIKFKLSPLYLSLVAFCVSMTAGVMWEFFEFGADMILHSDMQKDAYISEFYTVTLDRAQTNTVIPVESISEVIIRKGENEELLMPAYLDIGLIDTMKDLLVNFVGAFVFGIIGYVFLKRKGKGQLAKQLIPHFQEGSDG